MNILFIGCVESSYILLKELIDNSAKICGVVTKKESNFNSDFCDLASLCIEFKLNKNEEKIVLNSYFKTKKAYHKIKLQHYKIIYDSFCKLWFEANI